jgi:hemoglobin
MGRMRRWRGGRWVLGVVLAFAGTQPCGCAKQKPERVAGREEPRKSLFERLGGEPGIRGIVQETNDRALRDRRVNLTREGTAREWSGSPADLRTLNDRMTEFFLAVTGGPGQYAGRELPEAHRGMRITDAEFQAYKEDLRAALEARHILAPDAREFLRLFEDFRGEVVEAGPLGRDLGPARKSSAGTASVPGR